MPNRVCVIGAGYWGKNHIRTLHELNSLNGIIDSDKKKLKHYSNLYPDVKKFSDIEESLSENFNAYVIATPADTHFYIAKKLILLNKHILIEKPMTMSIEEAEELVFLSKRKKVNVLVGHVLLFHPAIKKIKEMIVNGEIGELQYLYSNRLNLGKVRTQENVFWSLAPHDIAIFQHLTESFPKKIRSKGSSFLQKGVHDSTITQIEYQNYVEAHIFVSWLHPFKEHRLVVIGSEGMISFEDSIKEKPLKFYSKKIDLTSGAPEKIDGPVESVQFSNEMPLKLELKYFLDHLNGKHLQFSNANEGLEVIKVLVEASKQLMQ